MRNISIDLRRKSFVTRVSNPKGLAQFIMKCVLLLLSLSVVSYAYIPLGKEHYFPSDILRDVLDSAYLDLPESRLSLGPRSLVKDLEEEQLYPLDYEGLGEADLHPSLRDREFLQHSSLFGNHFMSGGAGEGKQRLKPEGSFLNKHEIKTDATLPAYCNPPNPCPLGYTAENGCLEEFDNTAVFSRRYQESQDCMCDTEHMFDCPRTSIHIAEDRLDSMNSLEFNRFLQNSMQFDPALQHKGLVAKKFNNNQKSVRMNPFLTGERLPVAAKKGINMYF